MSTVDRVLTPAKRPPLLNRVMIRVLRSRASWLVDRGVMLVSVRGRRTGRRYTLPVQYARDDERLWVLVGRSEDKTWWRNLRDADRVDVVLRRRACHGRGRAYVHAEHPETVEEGLRRYSGRFPHMARGLGVRAGDDDSLARAAEGMVVVRIDLDS